MIPARATVFSFFRLSVYSRKNMLFGVLRTRYCTRKCILVWRTTLINHRGAIVDGLLAVLWVLCVFMSPSQQGSSLSIDRFIYIYIYIRMVHINLDRSVMGKKRAYSGQQPTSVKSIRLPLFRKFAIFYSVLSHFTGQLKMRRSLLKNIIIMAVDCNSFIFFDN